MAVAAQHDLIALPLIKLHVGLALQRRLCQHQQSLRKNPINRKQATAALPFVFQTHPAAPRSCCRSPSSWSGHLCSRRAHQTDCDPSCSARTPWSCTRNQNRPMNLKQSLRIARVDLHVPAALALPEGWVLSFETHPCFSGHVLIRPAPMLRLRYRDARFARTVRTDLCSDEYI